MTKVLSFPFPETYTPSLTNLPTGWRYLQLGEMRYANKDLRWASRANAWVFCYYTERVNFSAGEYITSRPLPAKFAPMPEEFLSNKNVIPPGFRYRETNEKVKRGVDYYFCEANRKWERITHGGIAALPDYFLTREKPRAPKAETPYKNWGYARANSTVAMNENNDCAVVALAIAANVPYDDAHAFWELHGRKRGCGTYTGRTMPHDGNAPKVFGELGISVTKVAGRGGAGFYSTSEGGWVYPDHYFANGTLRSFCKKFPTGRFIVCVANHALAVVDGVIHDHCRSDLRRVRNAYRIEAAPLA